MAPLVQGQLLNTVEAASYLGLSPSMLAKARVSGRPSIPFTKIGAAVRYRRSDLDTFVASNIHSNTASHPRPEVQT